MKIEGEYKLNWLDKLEKKLGRFAIPNLTVYLLAGLAAINIIKAVWQRTRFADMLTAAGGGFGPRGAPWRRSVAASRSFVLASPKILRLDNVQINLTLPSLNRTLADAEDTPPRQ